MTTDKATLSVYLAARYSRRAEMRAHAADLHVRGHTVTSRWLDIGHGIASDDETVEDPVETILGQTDPDADSLRLAERCAAVDVADLLSSNTVVTFTEPPHAVGSHRGGRHVEFGIAFGANTANPNAARRLIVVGPVENVFHAPSGLRRYPDWPTLLADLDHDDAVGPCGFTQIDPKSKQLVGPCIAHKWHAGAHETTGVSAPPPNRAERRRLLRP